MMSASFADAILEQDNVHTYIKNSKAWYFYSWESKVQLKFEM